MKFQSNSIFNGTITANSVANAGVNTNKFLVLNSSGLMTFRTAAEVLADIGASASGLPVGGAAGQILAKIDATNYNAEWIDNYSTQVKNFVKLGATLSKGTAVYVSGADGTNMIVSASTNAAEAGSSKTLGLLETGGATNDIVKVITYGLLAGLDTSTAAAGDPVWLGTNGGLIFGLANKPVAPAHMVYIGTVTRVQSNNGEIFVNVQNGFEMGEIHNYLEGSVQNNQVIVYESATSLYKPKSIDTILGYTPVTSARTLTINGTTYDLSANRSWTIDSTSASTRTIQKFTADGSSATYTITGGYAVGMVDVFINGIKLDNATEFTASNGTTVVIASTPASGDIVEVYKYGSQFIATNALRQKTLFTATAGQTTFTVTYSVGLVDVFYNGSKLDDTEYTATNGTSIVFNTACVLNDKVEVIAYTYNATGFTGVGGSGTAGYLSKWTASGTLNNSLIYDNGTNVGIGTTSPTSIASGYTSITTNGTNGGGLVMQVNGTATGYLYAESGSLNITNTSGYINFYNGGTDRFSIWNYGLLIKGTSTTANARFDLENDNNSVYFFASESASVAKNMIFYTRGSSSYEAMRITSGGNVLIGTSTDDGVGKVSVVGPIATRGVNSVMYFQNQVSSNYFAWYGNVNIKLFNQDVGVIGQFAYNTGAYTALSDVNKKKDFEESKIGLEAVLKLKPTLFRMKDEDDSVEKQLGFIAQEVKEHIPQAYTESGDENDKFIGLQDRPIIAALVKAIQEQQAQIEQLKQLIN